MEWHVGSNPCPHGKPYLMENKDCHRCPAYQECTSAVEVVEVSSSDEDDLICEYEMEDGQCGCAQSSQYCNGCECESDGCPYYSPIEIEDSGEDEDWNVSREEPL